MSCRIANPDSGQVPVPFSGNLRFGYRILLCILRTTCKCWTATASPLLTDKSITYPDVE